MTPQLDVFFFCADPTRDPCAPNVFHALEQLPGVAHTDSVFDGFPVLCSHRRDGSIGLFVRTQDVVSNDYVRYAGPLTERFSNVRAAVVVNWHEGANAPDKVLTFHSTGDVPSGIYAPTQPALFSAYTRALERERVRGNLADYKTIIEATHWSGVMFGAQPDQVNAYPCPIYDLEVGSSTACWADSGACGALARVCAFGPEPITEGATVIYCGGVHFEENVTSAVLSGGWHVGHVLPNHWLVAGEYDNVEGTEKLLRCMASCTETPDKIVVHKGLASKFKQGFLSFAQSRQLDAISHKQMRDAQEHAASGQPKEIR